MSEERVISDLVDKAIIEALNEAETGVLQKKILIRKARERTNANEGLIAKRLEHRCKDSRKYLATCGRGLYKLDPSIQFSFIGESLPPMEKPVEVIEDGHELDTSLESRKAHTHDLKVAISSWIDFFPQPTHEYSADKETALSSKIESCEAHPLFSDLNNHFSPLGIQVLSWWEDYKKEMQVLDEMKANIFEYSKNVVLKCFTDLDLHYAPRIDGEQNSDNKDNIICMSIPVDLYNYCFSYHIFYRSIGKPNPNLDIFYPFPDYEEFRYTELMDSIVWGGLIKARKKDRNALERGIKKLLEMFRNPPDNRFMFDVNVVIGWIEKANESKERIISELKRIQSYPSLPGDCDLLR